MDTIAIMFIVPVIFIFLDIVTGIAKALKEKQLSSTTAREGAFHKFGELMILIVALVCQEVLSLAPFASLGIPSEVLNLVAIYIIFQELLSILENIYAINPEMPLNAMMDLFKVTDKKE